MGCGVDLRRVVSCRFIIAGRGVLGVPDGWSALVRVTGVGMHRHGEPRLDQAESSAVDGDGGHVG